MIWVLEDWRVIWTGWDYLIKVSIPDPSLPYCYKGLPLHWPTNQWRALFQYHNSTWQRWRRFRLAGRDQMSRARRHRRNKWHVRPRPKTTLGAQRISAEMEPRVCAGFLGSVREDSVIVGSVGHEKVLQSFRWLLANGSCYTSKEEIQTGP